MNTGSGTPTGEQTVVTMPDGRQVEVRVCIELRCDLHDTVPGWGCESCRNFTRFVSRFEPYEPLTEAPPSAASSQPPSLSSDTGEET